MIFMEKDKIVLKQNDVQNAFDIFKILNNNTLDVFGQYVIQENDIIFTKNFRSVPVFEYPLRIDAYILVLCLNGSIDLDINLKLYHLVPNMAVILEPKQLVFHHNNHSDDFDAICCIISPSFVTDLAAGLPMLWLQNPILNMTDEWKNRFLLYWNAIFHKIKDPNLRYKKEILKNMFKIWIYEMLNMFESNLTLTNAKPKTRKDEIVISFIKLVGQDFMINRSVGYYADKLCITPKHLSKTMNEIRGITASEYIDTYIILEAKSQLKFTNRSIKEICNDLNFANQSFFGKFFKHHTGLSPLQYREKV